MTRPDTTLRHALRAAAMVLLLLFPSAVGALVCDPPTLGIIFGFLAFLAGLLLWTAAWTITERHR